MSIHITQNKLHRDDTRLPILWKNHERTYELIQIRTISRKNGTKVIPRIKYLFDNVPTELPTIESKIIITGRN